MNGLARRFVEINQPRAEGAFLYLLSGICLGIFVFLIFVPAMKFTYFLIGGPVILFIAIMTGRFKRFFQGLLIFVIPINWGTHFFRRPTARGVGGLDFSPQDVVLIVLYLIWIYELLIKKSGRFRLFPKLTIPLSIFVGISFLSMFKAQDPYLTLFETIRTIKTVLLILYVANHIRSKKDLSFVLAVTVGVLFLQSMLAIAQKWLGMPLGLTLFGEHPELRFFPLDYYLKTARVGGTLGHPNHLARYVELLLPLNIALLLTEIRLRYKLFSGLVFACASMVLLFTLSRGGWVCAAGSMILFLLLIFRAKLISYRSFMVIAVMVVLLVGISLGFSGLITSRLFGEDYGSAYSRIPNAKVALQMIRQNPLLGVGVKNYPEVVYYYNTLLEDFRLVRVHNIYLLIAAEMGIPGLLVFLWVLSVIFLQGLRNLKMRDILLSPINIGILSGMAALWAHWSFDARFISQFSMMWVLASLVMAMGTMYGEKRTLTTEEQIAPR